MTSTPTEAGPFDALEKARPDEPMFPLLARDPAAPATITEWCRLRRNRAYKLYGDSKRASDKKLLDAELLQCANAERVAEEMADWREGQDTPAAQRVSHGVQKSEEELREAAGRERVARLVQHLREAAYHLCEAKDGLVALDLLPRVASREQSETIRSLSHMLNRINGLADEHTTKRPGHEAEPALPLPAREGAL